MIDPDPSTVIVSANIILITIVSASFTVLHHDSQAIGCPLFSQTLHGPTALPICKNVVPSAISYIQFIYN